MTHQFAFTAYTHTPTETHPQTWPISGQRVDRFPRFSYPYLCPYTHTHTHVVGLYTFHHPQPFLWLVFQIMDYRGNSTLASRAVPGGEGGGGGFNDYSSGSISAVTSPTIARGSIRSTEQASPSSVIEELQGRFQNSTRSREKRPILKNASVNADHVSPVYQRRIATSSTATATLASRPHHRSELALPTTTAGSFEQPSRSINAASTVRLDPDPNGTLRAAGSSGYRGGEYNSFHCQIDAIYALQGGTRLHFPRSYTS